jgi:hypothetical protein
LILQSDRGGEFSGKALAAMLATEFPVVKHVKSRARHPQSNGAVERGNQTLEDKLGKWKAERGGKMDGWAAALPRLAQSLNTTYSRPIGTTPYEFMFNRKPVDPIHRLPDSMYEAYDDDETNGEETEKSICINLIRAGIRQVCKYENRFCIDDHTVVYNIRKFHVSDLMLLQNMHRFCTGCVYVYAMVSRSQTGL